MYHIQLFIQLHIKTVRLIFPICQISNRDRTRADHLIQAKPPVMSLLLPNEPASRDRHEVRVPRRHVALAVVVPAPRHDRAVNALGRIRR